MITVIQERDTIFTVQLDVLEYSILTQIAKGFSQTKKDALASCISKGFDGYTAILHEIAVHETRKRNSNEIEG